MPMNDAAERYSPEIAEAFQPTETDRPATKKSLAVFDVRAERNPIQMVTTTVISEKARIHGSTRLKRPSAAAKRGACMGQRLTDFASSASSAIDRWMKRHEMIHT